MDSAEAFRPCAAQEFHEDGLRLVVQRVGCEDAVCVAGVDEGCEEVVADSARGLFYGFAGLDDTFRDAGAMEVEWEVEADTEVFDKLLIGVGLCSAETVMDMDGAEAYAEGFTEGGVGGVKGEQ